MARTERESDNRKREVAGLLVLRDQQRACRMAQASAEKLEHTGPAEKERVASVLQREQLASTPKPPLPKGKETEPSVESTRSWGKRESRWARAKPWQERGGSEREHGVGRVDSIVKEDSKKDREDKQEEPS